ncbi:MAG: 16S rRNA (guanine(966)-N(2))-methyltransferase RsmD [Alphaproteobacteria bacterium]|jgi:16S rRNA (guanine966-N2)-methyltransferase|nr:16S rRNA (guanine(966)-N(2))-methyltransferase RsmD [Alphaproteobacteria bacterium]
MRIIAGKYRRRQLFSPPSSTRPTSDRAREAIFNIINSLDADLIDGAYVLDAFAGSGALGLEALSRGAAHATFLEQNRQAIQTLKENITNLGLESQSSVLIGDANNPPKTLRPMSLIFLDPPYDLLLEDTILATLHNQGWIDSSTLIVLETSSKRPLNLPSTTALIDQRRYGAALISFLKK